MSLAKRVDTYNLPPARQVHICHAKARGVQKKAQSIENRCKGQQLEHRPLRESLVTWMVFWMVFRAELCNTVCVLVLLQVLLNMFDAAQV